MLMTLGHWEGLAIAFVIGKSMKHSVPSLNTTHTLVHIPECSIDVLLRMICVSAITYCIIRVERDQLRRACLQTQCTGFDPGRPSAVQ
jgi:hypothetical protein